MNFEFNEWLHSNDCVDCLRPCADYIIRNAGRSSIHLDRLFHEEIKDDFNALPEVVAGQLWEFLKRRGEAVAASAMGCLSRNDLAGFMTLIADRFLDECLDERRTAAVNPAYAYYRHLRHVLSKSDEVNYKPTRQGSFFAYSFSPDLEKLPVEHWNHTYSAWPRPPVPVSEIHQKHGILKLSRYYWDEAGERFMAEYFLPVRELSRYVRGNYPLGCEIVSESSLALLDGESSPSPFDVMVAQHGDADGLGHFHRQFPRLECDVIEAELESLALDCLIELSERQRSILLRIEEGATLDEIAGDLGEKGASKVHYHLKKGYQILRRKWSLWGPPSPARFSEVDEEEFFIFYDKVIELCKTGGERRNK